MISLTRRQMRLIRSVFRRALGLPPKAGQQPVQLAVAEQGGSVRIRRNGIAVEYRFEAAGPVQPMTLPLAIFADCKGARDQPVVFSRQPDGTLLVQWQDKGVPIVRTTQQPEFDAGFPELPEELHSVSDGFLPALCDAMQTVDRVALRFATHCVQLCGATGRLLATDTRQALLRSGFAFPWDDQILLPWNGVFGLKELQEQDEVRIGRRDNILTLTLGPWKLHCTLETERRFPRIDDCIPQPGTAKTTLTISDGDAEFAATAIDDLPKPEFDEAVTVDLNGTVALRAKSDGPATELVLSNSRREGLRCCFVTDRRILQRARSSGSASFGSSVRNTRLSVPPATARWSGCRWRRPILSGREPAACGSHRPRRRRHLFRFPHHNLLLRVLLNQCENPDPRPTATTPTRRRTAQPTARLPTVHRRTA